MNTKERSSEMPRGNSFPGNFIGMDLNLEEFKKSTTGLSLLAAYQKQKKEPTISVRIKPRAKDHLSDDFKLVVKYEIEMSKE